MPSGYIIPFILGVVIYYFAEDVVHVRRFGPITDSTRSSETGGLAFRVMGLVLVGVGTVKFLHAYISW
ncbi:hypothetical protein [Halorussus halobius]|uniref:hypothetical protein n=1 Tax=Halorussus halobius TaxID=1710537 RepID=UPI00109306F8|nr:hypothetical protein [Halorussus halobius]